MKLPIDDLLRALANGNTGHATPEHRDDRGITGCGECPSHLAEKTELRVKVDRLIKRCLELKAEITSLKKQQDARAVDAAVAGTKNDQREIDRRIQQAYNEGLRDQRRTFEQDGRLLTPMDADDASCY